MKIYKYRLSITDEQDVYMPRGARILAVQLQPGELLPSLWVLVKEDEDRVERRIFVVGTGNHTGIASEPFIGTVQIREFVWHFFDGGER